MLDLQYICDHLEEVAANAANRGMQVDITPIISLRDRRRGFITQGDALRKEQKETSAKIPKSSAEEKPAFIARGKELRTEVAVVEQEQKEVEKQIFDLQSQIPNMTHPDTPVGRLEEDSVTVREVGEKPSFDFEPRDHVEIAEVLDLIDFEAGGKVAGHGFYYLKNEAVLLELALLQYAIEKLVAEGFTVMTTPDVARDEILEGIGYIPRGDETQIYSIENSDLSLVATAEITLGGMMKDEVVDAEKLPIKVAGISHCFRTEAGAHGRATRGIYRVHQFTKVEIFGFTAPDLEVSNDYHQMILRIEEDIFQGLGLPYRVLDICTGDMGGSSYRKYDFRSLDAWARWLWRGDQLHKLHRLPSQAAGDSMQNGWEEGDRICPYPQRHRSCDYSRDDRDFRK